MRSWLQSSNDAWRRQRAVLGLLCGLAWLLSAAPAGAQAHGPFLHKVQKGETLWSITQRYKVSVLAVQECNGGLENIHKIKVGEFITIPGTADGVVPQAPYAGLGRASSSVSGQDSGAVLPSMVFGKPAAKPGTPSAGKPAAKPGTPSAGKPAVKPGTPSAGKPAAKPGTPSASKPAAQEGQAGASAALPTTIAERRRLAAAAAAASASQSGSTPALAMISPVEPGGGEIVSGGRWVRASRPNPAGAQADAAGTARQTATKSAAEMIAFAKKFLGTPYVYGGDTPAGFDCSGFVQSMCRYAGVNIPRVADDQYYKAGTPVPVGEEKEGDLVFFETDPSWPGPSHVGICLGQGEFIHASSSGSVRINRLDQEYYKVRFLGSKRVL